MKVFGIAGWSGSGKTTLLTRLIPALTRLGVVVATVKHTHHNPALDLPESQALTEAGAEEVLLASSARFALIEEIGGEAPEPALADLVGRFSGIDLLLVEGFKRSSHPKIEVWNPALGKPMLAPEDDRIVAIAADDPVPGLRLPHFTRNETDAIARFIIEFT